LHARDRSCHVERRRLTRAVPSNFASCTVASFISAVFRYAKWTFNAALPDEDSSDSSFLISPGGAPGFFTGPSQVCSRKMGEPSPFLALGPTCRFARSRLHAPIYFRRGDFRVGCTKSSENCGVRLLGFNSHLRSAFFSTKPKKRSCLGLCLLQGLPDACLRTRRGSTPLRITGLRNPTARKF
jgi:hypothetical protein